MSIQELDWSTTGRYYLYASDTESISRWVELFKYNSWGYLTAPSFDIESLFLDNNWGSDNEVKCIFVGLD